MRKDGGLVEPDFLFQNGEPLSDEASRIWFQERAAEAKAKGATWCRYSIDETVRPPIRLLEAWLVRPPDEGQPRFQFAADADALLKARGVE